jgi:hypothetical protein
MTCVQYQRGLKKNSQHNKPFFQDNSSSEHPDIILKLKKLIRDYGRSNNIPKDKIEEIIEEDDRNK